MKMLRWVVVPLLWREDRKHLRQKMKRKLLELSMGLMECSKSKQLSKDGSILLSLWGLSSSYFSSLLSPSILIKYNLICQLRQKKQLNRKWQNWKNLIRSRKWKIKTWLLKQTNLNLKFKIRKIKNKKK